MAARQAVRITKEATFGTFNASASSADKAIIILSNDNPMGLMMKPRIWEIANAAYDGRSVRQGTSQYDTSGDLTTFLYPAQTALILALATTLSSGACRTIPSFTLDYLYTLDDPSCTVARERFLGSMIQNLDLNANNNGDGVLVSANMSIIAQKRVAITGTDFAEPAASDYPDEDPFLFQDSAGTLTIGSAVTNYSSLNLSIQNTLTPRYDEFAYPWRIMWRSRMTTLQVGLLQKTNTFRDAYEAQTPLSVEYHYDNGSDDLLIDLGPRNYVEPYARTRPLQGDFEETVTLRNKIDPATGTDIVLTYTPGA